MLCQHKQIAVTMDNVCKLVGMIGAYPNLHRRGNEWHCCGISIYEPDKHYPIHIGKIMFRRGKFSHVKWYCELRDNVTVLPTHYYQVAWTVMIYTGRLLTKPMYDQLIKEAAKVRDRVWQEKKLAREQRDAQRKLEKKKPIRKGVKPNSMSGTLYHCMEQIIDGLNLAKSNKVC